MILCTSDLTAFMHVYWDLVVSKGPKNDSCALKCLTYVIYIIEFHGKQ